MSSYEVLLFLHIALAIVWLGSGLLLQVLGTRAVMSDDPVRIGTIAGEAAWTSSRLIIPSSLAVLALVIAPRSEPPW
jgi:hypothetical protein